MEVRDYIQRQIANSYRLLDAAMEGTTDEQFNWTPPGTANPIRAAFIHLVAGEDYFIQTIIQGKSRIWDAEGWGSRIGLTQPPGRGGDWTEVKTTALEIGPIVDYQRAVRAATHDHVAALSLDEMARTVTFAGTTREVADMLVLLAGHITFHAGEIAAIKGAQGVKGLPF